MNKKLMGIRKEEKGVGVGELLNQINLKTSPLM